MTRAALLLSCLFAAACTVGDLPGTGNAGTDAGNTPGTDAPKTGNGCVDRIVPPGGSHTHLAGGTTHAGEGCLVAGCHLANNPGTNAPGYQFAGTVYKPGTTTPSAGVTVTVKSSLGATAVGVTDDAGNFNIMAGALPNPFPATVSVTACPTLTPMISTLSQGGGNCTSTGCHGTALPVTIAN
jgi:hypothetical protein